MSKTLLKFCGNQSLDDYQLACKSNADYIGFVFAKSKRQVKVEEVGSWIAQETPVSKKLVGIFVNQSIKEIASVTESIPLSIIQLHGDESPVFVKELQTRTGASIWKVIHHENDTSIQKMQRYRGLVEGYVIDKKVGESYGGTGQAFDWSYLPRYQKQAKEYDALCIVAGGINPDNLSELLFYQPDGIDISSGIEHEYKKSAEKINKIESRVSDHDKNSNTR
ncbi:phosphoribosylanthranilate isomerase [Sutcliffiella deserti]|uniref:phosphoribosylanthranilate isomerase n=1 Tax=Sutcliffiella deserti TaxID=2875501 RepID=UPI001CBFAEB4|nr:phosphoribosylanthranilate isomerase [Sutcliffiella deserti]